MASRPQAGRRLPGPATVGAAGKPLACLAIAGASLRFS